jgi:hypothetical protein
MGGTVIDIPTDDFVYFCASSPEICRGVATRNGNGGYIVANSSCASFNCAPDDLDPKKQARFCHNSTVPTFCEDLMLEVVVESSVYTLNADITVENCDDPSTTLCCQITLEEEAFYGFEFPFETLNIVADLPEFETYTAISEACTPR